MPIEPASLPDHPFTTGETGQLGLTRAAVHAALCDRELVRPLRGVYVRSDLARDVRMRAAAAALVISPYAVVQLRQLVPLVDGRSESPGESWTRLELVDHGLPEPELQHWVDVDGVPTYRLDLAYPNARIAIEYDGVAHHSSPQDRAHDEARRDWLRDHGWTVVVVTRESFTHDAVRLWTRQVRCALAGQR